MSRLNAPESQAPPTLVLCVDDNRDVTAVARLMIESDPTMRCVGCLDSADQLEEEVRRLGADTPLIVLLDATMPGKDPLEVMGRLASAFPRTRTILFSGYDDQSFIDRAVDAGAWGCLSKHDEPSALLRAVREVAAGNFWVSPRSSPCRER